MNDTLYKIHTLDYQYVFELTIAPVNVEAHHAPRALHAPHEGAKDGPVQPWVHSMVLVKLVSVVKARLRVGEQAAKVALLRLQGN